MKERKQLNDHVGIWIWGQIHNNFGRQISKNIYKDLRFNVSRPISHQIGGSLRENIKNQLVKQTVRDLK